MRDGRGFRLGRFALPLVLVGSLLVVIPLNDSAAWAAPSAAPGRGPVERPLPASAAPRHGLPPGVSAPAVPVAVNAGGAPRPVVAGRTLQVAAAAATAPVLRPGFSVGDTSLAVYFDGDYNAADPQSWTKWWLTVTDVVSLKAQKSAVLAHADVLSCQQQDRKYCKTLGAAQGWVLDATKQYTVTVTVAQPDGTEVKSAASNKAKPRKTDTPPSVPAGQAIGCGCPTVLGPTVSAQAMRGVGVNTATGAYSRTERDFVMASYGIPFNAARYYSSGNPVAGMFGAGWSWTYDVRVVAGDGAVTVRAEDASEAVFTRAADGSFRAPAGIRSKLSAVDGGWRLVTPDQRTLRFDAQGRLVSNQNARGHGVTLAYDSEGLLSTITDVSGRVVTLEWRKDLRTIFKITLPDNRSVQFDYSGGRLSKVQDPRGFTSSYTYDASGRLDKAVDARGNFAIRNNYDPAGRVLQQTDPEGAVTTFEWDAANQVAKTKDPDGVAVVDGYRDNVLLYSRNANEDVVNHRYDKGLRRNLVVDPKGNQEESSFDDAGNPVGRRAPEPFGFTTASDFDARNNMTARTDGRGNKWLYTFNEFNEMTSQRDPKQATGYRYTYDDKGQVTTRTDPRNKVTRYEYDKFGGRTAEVSPTGRRTEMTYDLTGRMTSVVDPRGTVAGANADAYRTRYVYDQQSRVKEVWQPGKARAATTDYDEIGNAVVVTDELGGSQRITYDKNSRVTEVKDPIGNITKRSYTPGGRDASATDGEGNTRSWTYDDRGRSKTETSPLGNANPSTKARYTTTFTYDSNGNLIRAEKPYGTDGKPVYVDTGFDALDRPTQQRDQFNVGTSVGYDNNGNVVEMTDEKGQKLTHAFDEANRRTGSTGAGKGAQITYDEMGNPLKQTTPMGGVISWKYDDDGRPVAITEPRGNVTGAKADDYTTLYAYDLAGNPESVTDPLGNVTKSGYDALNRVVSQTDANIKTTRYTYDDADRLQSVLGPDATSDSQATVYKYNANGQTEKVTDPLGHATNMEYDKAGRVIVSTDPNGRRREMVYDADSHLTQQVTARQVEPGKPGRSDPASTIFYAYDNLGRLVSKQLGEGGAKYTYGYDAKNRLVSAADPAGVQQHTYDATGRLTAVKRGSEAFGYTYDTLDRVATRTYPDGTKITAAYDEGDRVTALTSAKGTTSAKYSFGYDIADNLTKITYPTTTKLVQTRAYDRAGRLTSATSAEGTQIISAFALTLDPVGNPTKISSRQGQAGQPTVTEATAYAYDPANRLKSACYGAQTCTGAVAERIDYTYDLVGNRTAQTKTGPKENTTTAYTYDAADQLTKETTTGTRLAERTFDYDLEGNQTRAGTDRYVYALDHTLTSATIGTKTTKYSYDALGNRVAGVTGTGTAAVTQSWSWDINGGMPQLAVDSKTTSTATTKQAFLYDPAGAPLALLTPSGTNQVAHSYTHDWLGGVSAVVAANGAKEWAYDYDPFGVARGTGLTNGGKKIASNAPVNPMQFAGGYHDTSQGDRYQLRARNYDPGTGRFDAQDPAAQPASDQAVSSYAYANNRSTVLTDPTGQDPDAGGGMTDAYAGYYTPDVVGPADTTGNVDNPEYVSAKKSVDEAAGFISQIADEIVNLVLDLVGFNDAKKCVTEGDIVACISTALQAVPWGKLFKAAKVMIKAVGVGRRLVEAYSKLKAARAALSNIPRWIKKATTAAEAAADAGKYRKAAEAAASGAKRVGGKVKEVAKDAAQGVRNQIRKHADDGGESCKVANARGLTNSFAAGTKVKMAKGRAKAIEKVKPGDRVLATDPVTGVTAPQQVTATIKGTGTKKLIDLTFVGAGAGGGGPPATITSTAGHKFYVPARGWVQATDLHVGYRLRNTSGKRVNLTGAHGYTRTTTVYNLTVNDTHTYYVLAGNTPVLVHNCGTGGFKAGVGADEVTEINRGFGGQTTLNGSFENTMINASRYSGFWNKSAVVIRDIAGGHMFDNGNKRTAQAVVEQFMQRNNVVSGPTSAGLRGVIDRVGKGQLSSVEDISAALRGY